MVKEDNISERVYTIREGDTLVLQCLVTGHPRPQVSPHPGLMAPSHPHLVIPHHPLFWDRKRQREPGCGGERGQVSRRQEPGAGGGWKITLQGLRLWAYPPESTDR